MGLFKTYSEKEVKRVRPIVEKINSLEPAMKELSDSELVAKTPYFKEQLKNGKTLDDILNNVNNQLSNYDDFPKELNPMQRAMGWMSVEMNTIIDKSNSKIAEMMLQGTNMGIIEGIKLKNEFPDLNNSVESVLDEFIKFQQDNVEQLKKYL